MGQEPNLPAYLLLISTQNAIRKKSISYFIDGQEAPEYVVYHYYAHCRISDFKTCHLKYNKLLEVVQL